MAPHEAEPQPQKFTAMRKTIGAHIVASDSLSQRIKRLRTCRRQDKFAGTEHSAVDHAFVASEPG